MISSTACFPTDILHNEWTSHLICSFFWGAWLPPILRCEGYGVRGWYWFSREGIKSIINLQTPGEHAGCGPSREPSGFSYDPQDFMDNDGESTIIRRSLHYQYYQPSVKIPKISVILGWNFSLSFLWSQWARSWRATMFVKQESK